MKKIILFTLAISIFACKNKTTPTVDYSEESLDITTSIYPDNITKVFDAHGGLDKWKTMKSLEFTIQKPSGKEVTLNNLKSRTELIDTPTYAMGFDGTNLWVKEKDENEYKGNAKFYKGLMMYFYAMPFIVSDDGIIYEDAAPLVFEGKTYPGVLVSYEAGIGVSPDDQYVVYYDSETGQMEWLSYTVTFGKDGKSKNFKYIRYNDWETVNGLVLPKSISWYKYENDVPTELRNTIEFIDVKLSETAPDNTIFTMQEGGTVME